jgi:ribonuclease T1
VSGRGPALVRSQGRSARTATVAVAVLVLALVAVLVGLVGGGGSGAPPATSTSPSATRHSAGRDPQTGLRLVALSDLPREAQATVALIDAGGPFPYSQDGETFGNNERILPAHPRGWYREYTVRTPAERDRGPQRIVTGDHDTQLFYTADHYASFARVSR